MLTAFKEELKRLSKDPKDAFHLKVKAKIGKRATNILEDRLKQIILVMPNLLKRIWIHWEKKPDDSPMRKVSGFLFAYLYHPADFLNEKDHGLFGYLDDAYLVAIAYKQVMKGRKNLSKEDSRYIDLINKNKRYVKAVIPKEAKKIEDMLKHAIDEGKFDLFASAFQDAA